MPALGISGDLMAFAATTIIVNGTAPVLLVPGSPVISWQRQAVLQNTSVAASAVQVYLGGSGITGSNGFPLTGSAVLSVETRRQQDLYGAAAAAGASQAITVLMDLI